MKHTDSLDRVSYPFEDGYVTVSGLRIHYVDEGEGPLVLFVHGNPTWSFVYRDVIAALRTEFRCVAVDLPSFGLSDTLPQSAPIPEGLADTLRGFVRALGLKDFLLVVQDWGGPIGLTAALHEPDRVRGVVICNTWAWPTRGDKHFDTFSRTIGGPVGRWATRTFNLMTRVFLPGGHKERKLAHAEMKQYLIPLRGRARRRVAATLPRQVTGADAFLRNLEEELPYLSATPAVIAWAGKDIAFRENELHRWQRILPHAETFHAPEAGHYIQSDNPATVIQAIRHLHSTQSRPGSEAHDAE